MSFPQGEFLHVSLLGQRFHGVEHGGAAGGHIAENDADKCGTGDGKDDGARGEGHGEVLHEGVEQRAYAGRGQHARDAADDADEHGFDDPSVW